MDLTGSNIFFSTPFCLRAIIRAFSTLCVVVPTMYVFLLKNGSRITHRGRNYMVTKASTNFKAANYLVVGGKQGKCCHHVITIIQESCQRSAFPATAKIANFIAAGVAVPPPLVFIADLNSYRRHCTVLYIDFTNILVKAYTVYNILYQLCSYMNFI